MDYDKVGFKAGLEIHQQIDSGKLFSDAPSLLRKDEPDFRVSRKLHAVAGETGEVDIAVEHESSLDKEFVYEVYDDTVTLVELDEEPPRPINQDALEIALQIALLLRCEIYSVSQVMRKTVIDGSNTSGFQRTVLIAHDGYVETSFGKVPIESLMVEEDSARKIDADENKVVWRLDRLGIPLVEISTAPVMKRPEQVKECALKIGQILRACKVRRGIGTIRQDVNVSVKGHDRVEIKGFQDPKMITKTIDLEIKRQLNNIENKKKGLKIEGRDEGWKGDKVSIMMDWTDGSVRRALPNGKTEFLRPIPGRARMYPETDLELLRIGKDKIDTIKKELPKLKGDIKSDLKKKGLTDELIKLVLAGNVDEFTTLCKVYDKDANLVGKMITIWRAELAKKFNKSITDAQGILSERLMERILERVEDGKMDKSDVKKVLEGVMDGLDFDEAVKIDKADTDEVEEEIRKIVKDKPGLRPNAYMGLVMKKFAGKIDAKRAMEIINRILGS